MHPYSTDLHPIQHPTRRGFLRGGTSAAIVGSLGLSLASTTRARAAGVGGKIKVGLVGCGGRGTGAASQALKADPEVELHAVGDALMPQIANSLKILSDSSPNQVNVPDDRRFVGLDAFEKVIGSGIDVILLATPPGFRPQHLRAAIDAGLHVFCEKPMAVDVPGVRSVIESVRLAREKNLNLVSGFCWRYSDSRREAIQRVLDGQIGDVTSIYSTYYTGPVKPMPPASDRPAGMSDVEWQVRNWYNFSWLSGDSLVEQAVHSVDKIGWITGDQPPLSAVAVGGRQIPAHGGNIFDHFHVVYEFENGVRAVMGSRQQTGCFNENADFITGTKGECVIGIGSSPTIRGEERWRFRGEGNDMYQTEHDTLFGALRKGEVVNDGDWMVNSTMLAILGRMAAYSGQKITWEQAMQSSVDLAPDDLAWDGSFEPTGMPLPGQTQVI